MTVDLRHHDDAILEAMETVLKAAVDRVAGEEGGDNAAQAARPGGDQVSSHLHRGRARGPRLGL